MDPKSTRGGTCVTQTVQSWGDALAQRWQPLVVLGLLIGAGIVIALIERERTRHESAITLVQCLARDIQVRNSTTSNRQEGHTCDPLRNPGTRSARRDPNRTEHTIVTVPDPWRHPITLSRDDGPARVEYSIAMEHLDLWACREIGKAVVEIKPYYKASDALTINGRHIGIDPTNDEAYEVMSWCNGNQQGNKLRWRFKV